MKSPYYAGLVASVLSRAPEPQMLPSESRRAAAILQIEAALRKKATRRRQARWAAAVFTLSAAAAAAVFVARISLRPMRENGVVTAVATPTGGGARILTPSGSEVLRGGGVLLPGNHLVASANGGASVRLSTGTELLVEHDSNLLFSDAGPNERFMLSEGAMLAQVAKLRGGERFVISTPDAEVEVHGTVFRVAVVAADPGCPSSGVTRVEVREGVVEVRVKGKASYLHPGEHWPSSCDAAIATASTAAVQAEPVGGVKSGHSSSLPRGAQGGASTVRPANVRTSTEAPSEEALSLARAQNDLFSQAIAARRQGDTSTALSTFRVLMTRYPGCPLAENAALERMRLLAATNHPAAERAAREYLARYPRGFAANYAGTILNDP